MLTPTRRRFSLFDAMILVAAAAGVLALYRARFQPMEMPESIATLDDALNAAEWFQFFLPGVAIGTLATLVLRLRRPRPSLRRIARQPGFVACVTALSVLAAGLASQFLVHLAIQRANGHGMTLQFFPMLALNVVEHLSTRISFAVAAAWITQAVTGRWRPEPSWPDRLGRAVGLFWVVVLPVCDLACIGCLGS